MTSESAEYCNHHNLTVWKIAEKENAYVTTEQCLHCRLIVRETFKPKVHDVPIRETRS